MNQSFPDKAASFLSQFGATAKSLVKTAVAGGRADIADRKPVNPLIIMGNGPSLATNIENDLEQLRHSDTLAVNFAANSPSFKILRPKYYVLADPHFFKSTDDPNVRMLVENLVEATWPITLFVPKKSMVHPSLLDNPHLSVEFFSFNGFEGFKSAEHFAFDRKWGMPRPRNVLIPSIMIGIWMGYKEIYLIGADHTWTRTLAVDDMNHVISIQPHFYKDNEHEQARVSSTYQNVRLHEMLESLTVAFRSYHVIRRYADLRGVKIFNSTPGSFIDAFSRSPLPR